ncbi:PREDICTED: disease resistance protein RPP13-like [Camelina sativa]|uniref:Disease resistance protein RPP13-like n=1 Tax=Camelina sativa TaxID=90675 RepID=A0ABM0YMK3_CAMSA|nr:PREDICTED: disease resistance protein RPP13-like [Camelina sativa]
MVDAITGFVVGKIGNYLIEETSMLMVVKDDLEDLKTELTCIQGYLKDVEAREQEDEVSKEWTKLVLDIAYDVEDVLDTYFLKLEERSQRRGLKRLTNKIGRKIDAYNIVDDIRILKRRILDVTRKRETYGIGNFSERRGGESNLSLRVRELRRARSIDQEELVVGLEDDAKILLEKLLDEREYNRFIISIFGMGGLGKTALARKLYNSEEVKRRFEYRAWTYVSQEYKTGDILMRIIRSLGVASVKELEKIRKFTEEELEVYLHGILEGKKYLVVVDDIWEREAWESLKRALPCSHEEGCIVIITTRIRAVAEGVDGRFYAHKLRFLTFEESWKLFEQKAFINMEWVDEDLRKIGKEMVQKCSGLPLAIVVLSGLLSRKSPSEWNDVCNSLWRRLKDNSIHVSTLCDLSLKEMRQELKLCFLYLSIFPEDYEIEVEKLIQLLVAEGFIQGDEEMMMEDVARYYIEELIDRSLVEAVRVERGKVMTCRIHDLLRDVAIKKSKELNFVNVYNDHVAQHTCCRREVVNHQIINKYFSEKRMNKRMRSFLFFGESRVNVKTTNLNMKLLRVLNLGGVHFIQKGVITLSFPDVVGDLIHLRYFGIADTRVKNLPAFISNLRFLQTLDTSGNDSFIQTIDLRKLTSLRHVVGNFLGDFLISDAMNLQTLRSISSYNWSKLKHELLINLRDLEIYENRVGQGRDTVCWASLSKLRNLRVLKLRNIRLSLESEEAVRSMDVISQTLESVTLVGINLEEDLMPILQKLPRLEDLILKTCDLVGGKMSIREQGFGRLRKLQLFIEKLGVLQIEEQAMPNLIQLKLSTKVQYCHLIIPNRFRAFIQIYETFYET